MTSFLIEFNDVIFAVISKNIINIQDANCTRYWLCDDDQVYAKILKLDEFNDSFGENIIEKLKYLLGGDGLWLTISNELKELGNDIISIETFLLLNDYDRLM